MQRILLAVAVAFLAISGAAVAEETPAEGQERLLWEQATRENTPQSYGDYLRFYPRGKHAAEARRRLHEQTWSSLGLELQRAKAELRALEDVPVDRPKRTNRGSRSAGASS
jgi:hypothetical protein